jgi:carbamoyltransferase
LDALRQRGKLSYLALNELAALRSGEITDVAASIEGAGSSTHLSFVDHHKGHLANAFLQSGYEQADFMVLDGFGENHTGFCGHVDRGKIEELHSFPFPHSLGSFYSAFTDFVGFKPDADEWKVMALSALGDAGEYYDAIRPMVRVNGLDFELDLSFFEHFLFFKPRHFSQKLVDLLGPPLPPGAEPGDRECAIVAAVQKVLEETLFELLVRLHEHSGNKRLVAGGGVFMNCVCNGKLAEHTPYQDMFIGGSPDDSGIAVGSALYGAHYVLRQPMGQEPARHNYFGRAYSNQDILSELQRRKLPYEPLDDPAARAADLLQQGKIVGWFQGASEFGQRALGNRSILANPTIPAMKDMVNASVKYRERFRPFAPAVKKEAQDEVMCIPAGQSAYYMERVFPFRAAWKTRVPAVVHFDGTGRLQTVDPDVNPLFHRLICCFEAISGVPLVLNTSFNTVGMPIVETPGDAISCFYECGLDALVIGGYLVEKQHMQPELITQRGQEELAVSV